MILFVALATADGLLRNLAYETVSQLGATLQPQLRIQSVILGLICESASTQSTRPFNGPLKLLASKRADCENLLYVYIIKGALVTESRRSFFNIAG